MELFICLTNLQLLIAKAIIEKEQLQNVDLLFIGDSSNHKNNYYLQKLTPLCQRVDIFPHAKKTSFLKTMKRSLYARKIVSRYQRNYDLVLFANFHIPIIHHILSVISFDEIRTFDDGTNNINKQSVMYKEKSVTLSKRYLRRLMGRMYHKSDILQLASKHYTLFPEKSNIIQKTEVIELVNNKLNELTQKGIVKKVLLGIVYADATNTISSLNDLLTSVQAFIDEEGIDYYIPHPRDDSHNFDRVEIINDIRIAEEILLDLIEAGTALNLYGFNSTVQFNLSSCQVIKNYTLNSPLMKDSFNNLLDASFERITI